MAIADVVHEEALSAAAAIADTVDEDPAGVVS